MSFNPLSITIGSVPSELAYEVREALTAVWTRLDEGVGIRDFGALGNGTADDTAAIQAAIDSLPVTGGTVLVPDGTYMVSTIRLDGSAGGKSRVTIKGNGATSKIKKLANADIATTDGKRKSVIEALSGDGHSVVDLWVESNRSRGGVSPLYCANWVASGVYTYNASSPQIRSAAADGTVASPRGPTDRIFLLQASHTGDPTNILTDVGLGRWVEVTNQPFNWGTGAGYLNAWDVDTSYAYLHGIYMNGVSVAMQDPSIRGCFVTDCLYGGILPGSGPLFADLVGFGTDRAQIHENIVWNTNGSCIGGGNRRSASISKNTCYGTTSSPIKCDEHSHLNTITSNLTQGVGSATDGGITLYKSDGCVIASHISVDCAIGVWIQECTGTATGPVHTENCSTGISVNTSPRTRLGPVTTVGATSADIRVTSSSDVAQVGGRATPLFTHRSDSDSKAELLRVMHKQTTDAVQASMTDVAGSSAAFSALADTTSIAFEAHVVARVTSGGGHSAAFTCKGLARRDSGAASTVIVAQATTVDAANAGASGWALTSAVVASANTTSGTIEFKVTGAAATTIEWVLRASAVRYGT